MKPLVNLCITNSYYYDCGMLSANWIKLPADESTLRKALKDIQVNDDHGYIVLKGETEFKCTIPEDLDIFELNAKLNTLSDNDADSLKLVAGKGDLTLMNIIDSVLEKKKTLCAS